MACPYSVLASRGVSKPSTEYASEGVAAHTLSEWVREQKKPASHWKGTVLKVGEFEFKVGKAFIEGVQTFVDDCEELPGVPVIEGQVAYGELVEGGFGTLDDARIQDGMCVVTDLKFGRGVQVYAKDNPQIKLYALGLFFTHGWAFEFDRFVLRISQPRLHHFEEDEISLGHLLQWGYDVVRPAAKRALKPGAEIKAGSHCKFCPLKDTCAVRAAYKTTFERSPDSPEQAFINLEA